MGTNMYEKYKAGDIPEPYYTQIKCRAEYGKTLEEKWFIAGFFTADKIKKIRKAEGAKGSKKQFSTSYFPERDTQKKEGKQNEDGNM